MRPISITDVTMRQSSRSEDFSLSFQEKIELCKLLDRLGVNAIETTPITQSRATSLLIKSIASTVKESIIAVPVGLDPDLVPIAAKALQEAKHPRLVVEAPVSSVQMEYLASKKPAAMLETIRVMVDACCKVCADVEFVAEDATRAEASFIRDAIQAAIEAGATMVTVCDTAGTMLPDEFGAFLSDLQADVPELDSVTLGVSCSNNLYMADACAISAISAGAGEVKAAGYNLGTISLKHIASLISARGDLMNASTTLRTTQLSRATAQISRLCRTGEKSRDRQSEGEEDGLYLTAHDDITAVMTAVASLGYELSEEDSVRVYEAFSRIAAKKERVSTRELDAIVASAAMQVPATYTVERYIINTGNVIHPSASIQLSKNGEILEGISLGDGPIDAAFHTIEEIIGHHYDLDDFQIQSVTDGREAMGEAVVKLRSGGKLYSGQGISTDIVGSSIRAYINALNKVVYEEGQNA